MTKAAVAFCLVLTAALAAAGACSRDEGDGRPVPGRPRDEASPTGAEPESFSCVVARSFEGGATYEALYARDGVRSREEWTEGGRRLALIARPDLGRVYLLDVAANTYSDRPSAPAAPDAALGGEDVEMMFPEPGAETVVSRERVGSETTAGHECVVYHSRIESVAGAASESTVWEAQDLGGLAIRSELRGPDGSRAVSELRDIKVPADGALFELPPGATPVDAP